MKLTYMNATDNIKEEKYDTPKSIISDAQKSWRPKTDIEADTMNTISDNLMTSISHK